MTIAELLVDFKKLTIANDTHEAFVGLCRLVYDIKQCFAKEVTYFDIDTGERHKFDSFMKQHNLEKTQTSRFLSAYDKYFDNGKIKDIFIGFTKWQLFYLLVVPSEVLDSDIKIGRLSKYSTIKEICKYASANKDKTPAIAANIDYDERNIPLAYNPTQHYDFAYFEEKTKAQLLNIVWELQKYVEKRNGVK